MKNIVSILIGLFCIFVNSAFSAITALKFTGQGFITQGQSYYYNDVNAVANAFSINPQEHDDLMFTFETTDLNRSHWWAVAFNYWGNRLEVGRYKNAARWHTGYYSQPDFDIFGDGRGSNTVSGWFEIFQIEMSEDRSQVLKFAADFMHYSEGIPERWTSGSIRYNSDVEITTIIPEPGPVMISSLSLLLFLRRRRK